MFEFFKLCFILNFKFRNSLMFVLLSEKGLIVAGAILNVFATIGFYLFFALSVFFLCGLYSEKSLATGAVVTSFLAGG